MSSNRIVSFLLCFSCSTTDGNPIPQPNLVSKYIPMTNDYYFIFLHINCWNRTSTLKSDLICAQPILIQHLLTYQTVQQCSIKWPVIRSQFIYSHQSIDLKFIYAKARNRGKKAQTIITTTTNIIGRIKYSYIHVYMYVSIWSVIAVNVRIVFEFQIKARTRTTEFHLIQLFLSSEFHVKKKINTN